MHRATLLLIVGGALAVCGLAAWGLAGCGTESAPRNVILVTLDTVRADHLAQYGRPDVRTPVLDAWAREGAVVEAAIADVPLTLPSHATLLTAIPALGHGVRTNTDFRLTDAATTLAERLREGGWATGAVVSSLVLAAQFGLAQGFSFYEDRLESPYVRHDTSRYPAQSHWLPDRDRRADEALDRALAWLEGGAAAEPFFLWLHLYDAHFPYDAPPPWGALQPDPYLAEIEFLDAMLGRLRRWLRESGRAAGTVLLVTADHGEGLDDHREEEHGIFVYDETVRVPLLVVAPGTVPPAGIAAAQVRTVDVAPTLLELAAGRREAFGLGGSLVPLLTGRGPAPDSLAYSESLKSRLAYGGSGLHAIRSGGRKFVRAPRPELYDLAADPGETRNLLADGERASADDALAAALEERMGEILDRTTPVAATAALDEETTAALRSLGYVAGAGAAPPERSLDAELACDGFDPKDLVDVSMSGRDIQNGFYAAAARKARRFLTTMDSPLERPEISPLWSLAHQNLAVVQLVRGEFDAATANFREALRYEPENREAQHNLVFALNLGERPAEGVREGERLLARNPDAAKLRIHYALSLALLGRREDARGELRTVTTQAPATAVAAAVARLYLEKLGTSEERAYLDLYLQSEGREGAR